MKLYLFMVVSAGVFVLTLLVGSGILEAKKADETSPSANPPYAIPYVSSVPPMPREFVMNPDLHDIFFDRGSAKIGRDMLAVLDKNAEWLKKEENYLILVEGHADEVGYNESNLYLK